MPSSVEQYEQVAMQLIQEATAYAATGKYDEQTDQNIRRCRVIAQVLMTALVQAQLPQPPAEQVR